MDDDRDKTMQMIHRVFKGLTLVALLSSLTACTREIQYYADHYSPHAKQSDYLHRLQWLRDNEVQVVRIGDQLRLILPTDKFFEPNSTEFVGTKDCVLAEIARMLKDCGRVRMDITGHTDDTSEYAHQKRLTDLQAQTVAAYLWQHGVYWHRQSVEGLANDYTVASDRTIRGSKNNRRVEIRID